ncbi:MAG: DUF5640 domain-containing protein [Defluviitaleaceae bacterium]|nr:DUF5640 domain-containing protein [Defluviitaleaceae bacterium]
MKKIFALIILIGLFTGCFYGNDENLFGEWLFNVDGTYTYVFYDDGTGERGFPETRHWFTWETRGERLKISHEQRVARHEIQNEVWTFEIEEDVLTITNNNNPVEEIQFSYFTAIMENNPGLVGIWSWEESETFTYVFNGDGTGTRGFPGEDDSFTWAANDSRLNIFRDNPRRNEIRGELWTFELNNDRLVMTSLQQEDFTNSYTKLAGDY